nr:M1 family metallopeptidase [uncultured Sphingomonas sp.]
MFKIAAPLLPLLLPLSASAQPVEKGMPPISAQTQRSGGALSAERAALRLRSADLAIEVIPARQQLSGVATLELRTLAPVQQLRIDLDTNLPVSTVALAGKPLPRATWSHADGVLTVTPNSPLAAGASATLRITYAGTPHVAVRAPWDDGIVWSQAPGGAHWVATTAQGYGCDLFWPCLDFPQGEPAVVTLHITVPKGLKAPANGVLLGVDTLADGRTTWNWRAKTINPYDIALNIGPYAELSGSYRSRFGNSVPLHYWYLPGKATQAKRLFAEFAPTLDFFETLIGPFPFGDEKLGVVETPHMGMEHQTINAYGNNYAQAAEGFDWLFQHELSHEWFGNQMTAVDWDDFWLHEGFAQYMQPLYGRWREGEARYAAMMAEQRLRIFNKAPLVSGTSRTSEEVYEDGKDGPGGDIYFKGAWVLHTLRNLIGDAAFFDATRRLVYGRPDPRPGNFQPRFATTPEFEKLAAQAAGRDLDWFFGIYVHEAALPELVETRDGDQLHLRWKTPNARPFPMPVEVQVGERLETVLMTGNQGSLTVPAGVHVVVDPMARILRRSEAVERYQAQRAAK